MFHEEFVYDDEVLCDHMEILQTRQVLKISGPSDLLGILMDIPVHHLEMYMVWHTLMMDMDDLHDGDIRSVSMIMGLVMPLFHCPMVMHFSEVMCESGLVVHLKNSMLQEILISQEISIKTESSGRLPLRGQELQVNRQR